MEKVRHVPRRRGHTRITSKNQATIPVAALRESGLGPGDEVRVQADGDGRIVLERIEDSMQEWIERWAGSLTGVYEEGYLEELRKDWDDRP